jgi:glycosyltransferase involved in cell wall biosynthesis
MAELETQQPTIDRAARGVPCILQVGAGMDQGGVEQGTLEMARHIVGERWRSLVASGGGRLVDPLLRTGAEHLELPLTSRDPFHIVQNALKLQKIILENGVSLVHARSRAPAWSALLACRLTNTPFITTFHGTYGTRGFGKKLYNSSMLRGQRIIAISDFIKQHILATYTVPEDKIRVVPRGFDPARFAPERITAKQMEDLWELWDVPSLTPVILMPGRLTRWKGQEVFLRALAKIEALSWKAVIVGGEGRKDAYLQRLRFLVQELGIERRVVFAGSMDDMGPVYAASDVVVSASIEPEAFGRIAVEAQAMGRPVIATAHGGSLETIKSGETGWLVRPNDPDKLALAMADAITDMPRLKRMGEAGKTWTRQSYTLTRMCMGEFEVYRDVLGLEPTLV